jgi:hypothetical protein
LMLTFDAAVWAAVMPSMNRLPDRGRILPCRKVKQSQLPVLVLVK